MVRMVLGLALVLVVGCQKEEPKLEPAAPEPVVVTAQPATAPLAKAAAPAAQVAGGARVVVRTTAGEVKQVPAAETLPLRLRAEDGRQIRGDGTTTVMKAEDGRKITKNANGEMVLDDPSRPGAKIVIPAQ